MNLAGKAWTVGAWLAVLVPAGMSAWLMTVWPLVGALVVALVVGYSTAWERRNNERAKRT